MPNANRLCKKCKVEKSLKEFTPNKNCAQGVEHECKVCSVKRRVKWEYDNRDARDDIYFRHHYNFTKTQYDALLESQGHLCAICHMNENDQVPKQRAKRLAVDHCHKTGKVRGLLCRRCNTSLGGFKDSISNLENAIKYLQETQ